MCAVAAAAATGPVEEKGGEGKREAVVAVEKEEDDVAGLVGRPACPFFHRCRLGAEERRRGAVVGRRGPSRSMASPSAGDGGSAMRGCSGEGRVIWERGPHTTGGGMGPTAAPAVAVDDTAVVSLSAGETVRLERGGPAWCWWERCNGESCCEDDTKDEREEDKEEAAGLLSSRAAAMAASALACSTHCRRKRKAMEGWECGDRGEAAFGCGGREVPARHLDDDDEREETAEMDNTDEA